jgi:hypothetical protein
VLSDGMSLVVLYQNIDQIGGMIRKALRHLAQGAMTDAVSSGSS